MNTQPPPPTESDSHPDTISLRAYDHLEASTANTAVPHNSETLESTPIHPSNSQPYECADTPSPTGAPPTSTPPFFDLSTYLDGSVSPETPSVLEAWSGRCLFYAGRLNAIHADPGAVLNNVVGAVIARVLSDGGSVIYIDTEGTPSGFVSHLRHLGVAPDAISTRALYLGCSDPADVRAAHHWAVEHSPAMVVLDGLAAAMAAAGADAGKEHEVRPYLRQNLQPFADAGAAVVIVERASGASDKDGKSEHGSLTAAGRYDGVSYRVVAGSMSTRRQIGYVRLKIVEDRLGGAGNTNGVAAKLHFTPSATGLVTKFKPSGTPTRPVTAMKRITEHLMKGKPANATELRRLGGNAASVDLAVKFLIEDGVVDMFRLGRRNVYVLKPPPFVDVIELNG